MPRRAVLVDSLHLFLAQLADALDPAAGSRHAAQPGAAPP